MQLRFGSGSGTARTPSLADAGLGASGELDYATVMSYLPFLDDPLAVYYSGSHATGWNHDRSDLDIYVVTRDRVIVDEALGDTWEIDVDSSGAVSKVSLLLGALGPFRSDIEFWRESQIEEILGRLPDPTDLGAALSYGAGDREFLDKLRIAKPIGPSDWLTNRQQQLIDSKVHRALAKEALIHAHGALEDTEGFISSGDFPSGVLAAKSSFNFAVDGLLLAGGDLAPQPKWRARRVRAANSPALPFDQYWAWETMADYDGANPSEWIDGLARQCHDLLIFLALELA